ncbi:MAG: YigZ family protein [Erysipelotrichaceae bacterium]|nr:YigZ family protein [Erysipelotrichaceae bacterium]
MRIQFESEYEIEINKSRFICYLKRVESEEEFRDYLAQIKKMHPKATHHCSALCINSTLQRSNDDGEPSGTAGIPMLEVLRKRNMEQICAITVRYFGGILLGAGGLIRAYSRSVSEALDHTDLYEVKEMDVYQLKVDYSTASRLDRFLSTVTVLEKTYEENVLIRFATEDKDIIKKATEALNGKYTPEFLYSRETEIKTN